MSSSSLRVLAIGNNPNILFYTSRFQLAKNIDLYHVNDSKSCQFEIETEYYGKDQFELENHFTSIEHLTEALNSKSSGAIFDIIIMSAQSLQELSSLASKLTSIIDSNTKIFLESSGFIQLEPFVKLSMDSPHVNVFSILTDLDIRQIGPNQFKHFRSTANENTIYLGESKSNTEKYQSGVITLLTTFEKLFAKLFSNIKINLCNFSSIEFLSQQWKLAISRICFDPLLIMFEQENPSDLDQQIIAKPLISGLVTEIITVAKTMGARLNSSYDNENALLSLWKDSYQSTNKPPALVYHFIHQTTPLNIDILLLQTILLADDFGIKTPYLEFLYSVLSQFERLNNGKSKWFIRSDEKTQVLQSLQKSQKNELTLQNQISTLQSQIGKLRQELVMQAKQHELETNELKEKHQVTLKAQAQAQAQIQTQTQASDEVITPTEAIDQSNTNEYKATGTPNLRDIEDMALYSVNYGDSPVKSPPAAVSSQPQINSPLSSHSQTFAENNGSNDKLLQERELQLRRKELELQERELEFQKRALQQQRFTNNNNSVPRKPSFPQLQQSANIRSNSRGMHGTNGPIPQPASAGNFVDPISSNMAAYDPQQPPSLPLQQPQQSVQVQPYHSHSIKPTSRKNRNSNMPNIGNPSSINMSDFGRPQNNSSQTRLSSMPTHSIVNQNRLRSQQSKNKLNMPHAAKPNNAFNQVPPSNLNNHVPTQRQFSSSTMIEVANNNNKVNNSSSNPDISTSSVVHNAMQFTNNTSSTVDINDPKNMAPPPTGSVSAPSTPTLSSSSQMADMASPTTDNGDNEEKTGGKKKRFGLFKKKNKSKR
ncbi:Svl3p [Saccharomyces paradoxus]|uniref:Svl3p n=1 Tax=Saccharomyces paradoxus TaxID=27291 RepID=A0A8B8V137_SACPA|nr:Svl3 [Saccharomyces paradoxus]QHS76697.1 Svl3 [Saccharomyces paradoxus]